MRVTWQLPQPFCKPSRGAVDGQLVHNSKVVAVKVTAFSADAPFQAWMTPRTSYCANPGRCVGRNECLQLTGQFGENGVVRRSAKSACSQISIIDARAIRLIDHIHHHIEPLSPSVTATAHERPWCRRRVPRPNGARAAQCKQPCLCGGGEISQNRANNLPRCRS